MIITEEIRAGNSLLTKTYSDEGKFIERDGVLYSAAVDPAGAGRTYTETDIPIKEDEDEEI